MEHFLSKEKRDEFFSKIIIVFDINKLNLYNQLVKKYPDLYISPYYNIYGELVLNQKAIVYKYSISSKVYNTFLLEAINIL